MRWTPVAIKTMLQLKKEKWTLRKIGEYFDCDAGVIKGVLNRKRLKKNSRK